MCTTFLSFTLSLGRVLVKRLLFVMSRLKKVHPGISTARIRRMTEGYVFTRVCLLTGRVPSKSSPDEGGGGTPIQSYGGGYPNPSQGVSHPVLDEVSPPHHRDWIYTWTPCSLFFRGSKDLLSDKVHWVHLHLFPFWPLQSIFSR